MAYQQLEQLPQEVKEQMSEYCQRIYMAAYNSVADNSGNEDFAHQVALNTIQHGDEFINQNGKWQSRTDEAGASAHGAVANASGS